MSSKVSVVIPAANEQYLQRTIDDLFEKATGEVEIIAVLDGYWPNPPLKDRDNLIILHNGYRAGLRNCVNAGAQIATGKYLMKTDAHCMFQIGWDEVLKAECDSDWVVIPRRVSLDPINWIQLRNGKSPVDYEYVSYPFRDLNATVRTGNVWKDRARERINITLDDDLGFQGSCWFMPIEYFHRKIGPLQTEGYGGFILEPEEISFKSWTSGGQVKIQKKTQYAHWHKGKENGRGYFIDRRELIRGRRFHVEFWWKNQWPGQIHTYEWLIKKFSPIPTWPDDLDKVFATPYEELVKNIVT